MFYLSFANETSWLGGCFVPGHDIVRATFYAHHLGCNPGGEVLGFEVPEDVVIPKHWQGRLLSKDELVTMVHELGLDAEVVQIDSQEE